MNRCISVIGALILLSAFVSSADDELFKMCHDYQRDKTQIFEIEVSHITAMYNLYYIY